MPGCDFYAAGVDVRLLVEFVLGNTSCRVFEASSRLGRRLREFGSFDALRAGVPREDWPPRFALWPISANAKVRVRRVRVAASGRRRASWREEPEGWGVIQLALVGVSGRSLGPSRTSHNSAARAARWRATYPELGPVSAWDFDAVTRESARLVRFIQAKAVDRLGPRPVLPGAAALFEVGVEPSLR